MQNNDLEPGMLRVFRLFAWLLLASKMILPLHLLRGRGFLISLVEPPSAQPSVNPPPASPDLTGPFIFIGFYLALVFALLYWPWLQRKLGRAAISAALVISTVGLLIEQSLLMRQGIFSQVYPFLTILLILVAWQYSYRHVVAFTLLNVLIQAALIIFFPTPQGFPNQEASQQPIPVYGFLVSLPITYLVLGYVVSQLVSAQRVQRQALAEANQKLISHAATLEQLTISRERIRLSRELHDTLAHTLSALSVQFEALLTISNGMPPKAQAMLEKMQLETRSGLDETRRALSALRASPLEDLGLPTALRALSEDFASRHSLELKLKTPEELDNLPMEVEQGFYRVAQEALENVGRHAHASQLQVCLEGKTSNLALTISDDGEGFLSGVGGDETKFGLRGMQERADLIGAKLVIDSQAGKGTIVRLVWEAV
jgi:signal transduction histidine kinase